MTCEVLGECPTLIVTRKSENFSLKFSSAAFHTVTIFINSVTKPSLQDGYIYNWDGYKLFTKLSSHLNRSQGEWEWVKSFDKMVKRGGKMGGCSKCEIY